MPSGGIVGEKRSTRSKTTVRCKRVGPLGQEGEINAKTICPKSGISKDTTRFDNQGSDEEDR